MGGLGEVAVETMSMGKPLIEYVDSACNSLLSERDFTVLNCHSEAEIENCLIKCKNSQYLESLVAEAKKFLIQYYEPKIMAMRYLFYAELAAGKTHCDYGWEKTPYRSAND